jgi:hypothetical protein
VRVLRVGNRQFTEVGPRKIGVGSGGEMLGAWLLGWNAGAGALGWVVMGGCG